MQAVYLQTGGLPSPNPGASKNRSHMDLLHPHAGSLFANGGATSPPTPRFFKLCKKTSSIILPARPEPIWTGSEPVLKTLCLQTGLPPPNPPAFFLRRAGLLSRASYHEQELVQAHRGYRPLQKPSCTQSICKWCGYVSRSHMDPFRTRDLCLQMEGAAPPPTPLFLFTPCRLAFKNIAPSARLASRAQLL